MKAVAQRALILGVTGQDGAYLVKFLIERGYEVHGTSRAQVPNTGNLARLGIDEQVRIHRVDTGDRTQITGALQAIAPSEVYNLSGQSSVGLSYTQPVDAFMSHAVGTLNILESLRSLALEARLFNPSSGEIFGNTGGDKRADETWPIDPCSPYGAAKAAATLLVKSYRDVFGLFACSGFMFNHESPLRPQNFVAQRIVHGAIDIAQGRRERLTLGNLNVVRDWGWAPDFVGCMWAMLRHDKPRDFVIATGAGTSLEDFVDHVFGRFKLNWKDRVDIDDSLKRPNEIERSVGNPAQAQAALGWGAQVRMPELADRLIDAALAEAA